MSGMEEESVVFNFKTSSWKIYQHLKMTGGADKAHTCEIINSEGHGLIDYGQLMSICVQSFVILWLPWLRRSCYLLTRLVISLSQSSSLLILFPLYFLCGLFRSLCLLCSFTLAPFIYSLILPWAVWLSTLALFSNALLLGALGTNPLVKRPLWQQDLVFSAVLWNQRSSWN